MFVLFIVEVERAEMRERLRIKSFSRFLRNIICNFDIVFVYSLPCHLNPPVLLPPPVNNNSTHPEIGSFAAPHAEQMLTFSGTSSNRVESLVGVI